MTRARTMRLATLRYGSSARALAAEFGCTDGEARRTVRDAQGLAAASEFRGIYEARIPPAPRVPAQFASYAIDTVRPPRRAGGV